MKLIVGLGNPGEKYQDTRHNVGSMMVDFVVSQIKNEKFPAERDPPQGGVRMRTASREKMKSCNQKLKYDKYMNADRGIYEMNNEKVILIKPQTFMNQSGQAVKSSVERFKIDIGHELYIVHDDLDIRLGEYKIQKGKGPKLHNGIISIENALGTSDFWRVRVGVDNRDKENRTQGETYILEKFKKSERQLLFTIFDDIIKSITI